MGNSADTQGGAVYCANCGFCAMMDATFESNTAQQGGAVFAARTDSTPRAHYSGLFLALLNVAFKNNTAVYSTQSSGFVSTAVRPSYGGAVYSEAALMIMDALDISSDNSAVKGHGVFWRPGRGGLRRPILEDAKESPELRNYLTLNLV